MEKQETVENELKSLFEAGVHFGNLKSRRHPSTTPFIFGVKNRTEIINLEATQKHLQKASEFLFSLGQKKKQVLFVGGKHEARHAISASAEKLGMPFVATRWLGGTLTNFSEIKKRVERLTMLREQKANGELARKYTKREQLLLDREIEELGEHFSGLLLMKDMPAALVVVDPDYESIAVREALQKKIPIVALANSDCNLSTITYPVIGNDASRQSIALVLGYLVNAYQHGEKTPA